MAGKDGFFFVPRTERMKAVGTESQDKSHSEGRTTSPRRLCMGKRCDLSEANQAKLHLTKGANGWDKMAWMRQVK